MSSEDFPERFMRVPEDAVGCLRTRVHPMSEADM